MPQEDFECGICAEDKPLTATKAVLITGTDHVCLDCFQSSLIPAFKASLEDVRKFPYHWGDQPLRFQAYGRFIPPEDWRFLLNAYEVKRTEIETPKAQRQYCRNDGTNSVEEAYKDKQRGKDYNFCPACGLLEELLDGCNTISCSNCQTEWCFICSQPAKHKSDHWVPGNPCPRFGQPGDPRAVFDGAGVEIVEDGVQDGVYVPGEEDFALRRHVAAQRQRLREVFAPLERMAAAAAAASRGSQSHSQLLTADFVLALQNLAINIGYLDFIERAQLDLAAHTRRHEQINAFLERKGSGQLVLRWSGILDIFKDYFSIQQRGRGLMEGRPFIDQERRRRLFGQVGRL